MKEEDLKLLDLLLFRWVVFLLSKRISIPRMPTQKCWSEAVACFSLSALSLFHALE